MKWANNTAYFLLIFCVIFTTVVYGAVHQPTLAVFYVLVFAMVLFFTRYISLSSILAGVALPICVLWVYNEKEVFYRVFAVAVAALISRR